MNINKVVLAGTIISDVVETFEEMKNNVICGDCLEVMKDIPG